MVDVPIIKKDGDVRGISPARLSPVNQSAAVLDTAKFVGQVGSVVEDIQEKNNEDAKKMEMLGAQRMFDAFDEDRLFSPQNGALNKTGKDTIDISKSVLSDFDNNAKKFRASISEAQRTAFDEMTLSRRATVMKQITKHEADNAQKFKIDFSKDVVESGKNRAALFFNDDRARESSIQNAKDALSVFAKGKKSMEADLPGDLEKIESEARLAVLSRYADNDPAGAIEFFEKYKTKFTDMDAVKALKILQPTVTRQRAKSVAYSAIDTASPKLSRDEIIKYVMYDLEGGEEVVKDGDGTTKFGVNSSANKMTDQEVADLTPEAAAKIKKERYWDKYNIDALPVEMRLVAYDGYIHGFDPKVAGKTLDEVIKEADGDPMKVISARRDYYQKLLERDPKKYAPVIRGWMSRLEKLSQQVSSLRGEVPDERDILSRIDEKEQNPEVATEAKKLASSEIRSMKEARNKKFADANEAAWRYVANGKEVPPSVQAEMSAEDIQKMKSRSEPDPKLYYELKQKIASGQDVDLNGYRWQLGAKYGELLELKDNPKKMVNVRTVQQVRDANIRKLIGKSKPSGKDWERIDSFDRAIDRQIMLFQSTTGKTATPDEVQKIADRLLLEVDKEVNWGFDKSVRAFEIVPDKEGAMPRFSVKGIPDEGRFFIGGKQMTSEQLISTLISFAENTGIEVNADNLSELYKQQIEKKKIVWKEF